MKIKLGNKGFTFTEMSLALVLGGMLMGTVLNGESIVDGFKMQSFIKDLQGISAACNTYFNRYNAMPGDDTMSHGWGSVTNGNSNGLIEGASDGNGNEAHEAWQALRFAGLVVGDPDSAGTEALPVNPYGGRYALGHRNFGQRVGIRNCIDVKGIAGSIAEIIDAKYDDGKFNTGTISASSAYTDAIVDLYYAM